MLKTIAMGLGLTVMAAQALAGSGIVENYTINAQYRGGVKKGFQDLGSGKVAYESLGGSAFRVKVKGDVRHPNEDKEYSFRIYEKFSLAGNSVRLDGVEKKELNEHAAPHEARITELLPFAYLVRRLPAPAATGGDASRTLSFNGQSYTLRYRTTETNTEVDLLRGDTQMGKFFLQPGTSGGFAKLEKFRMPLPAEELVVSFVTSDSYAMGGGSTIME